MTRLKQPKNQQTSPENAQIVALQALNFIASDDDRLGNLLLTTGLDLQSLRAGAVDPAFLAGILDFLLGDEPLLLAFAAEAGLPPEQINKIRYQLPGTPDAS